MFPLNRCFVNFPNVHIQKVSSSKRLMAVFAVVGEHARKVDVLNVVAQVTSIGTSLSTDSAFVGSRTTLREFDNVFIQRLVPCKRHTVKTQFKIFIHAKPAQNTTLERWLLVTWWFSKFFVGKVSGQYLHV